MCSHRENRRIVVPALAGATCRTEDNTVVLFSSSFVHFPFLTTYWLIYYLKNVSYFYIRQTARLLYEEIPLNNQIGQSIHIKWGVVIQPWQTRGIQRNLTPSLLQTRAGQNMDSWRELAWPKYTWCSLDFGNPFHLLLLTQGSFLSQQPYHFPQSM